MSLVQILEYMNYRDERDHTRSQFYGTENFAFLLYSLLLMEQPNVVVELGTGAATTAIMAAEALRQNGRGQIWTVDDGLAWRQTLMLRRSCQRALGYEDANETYGAFIERISHAFGLENSLNFVEMRLGEQNFFCPESQKIDVLFADAGAADPEGCTSVLRYYLPKMAKYSSIFIDRASTIHYSFLLLNYFVAQLDRGRIPMDLLAGMDEEAVSNLRDLVSCSSFSIVHLTETARAKRHNPTQNSRAWIRIQPLDHIHHNDVINYTLLGRRGYWPERSSK